MSASLDQFWGPELDPLHIPARSPRVEELVECDWGACWTCKALKARHGRLDVFIRGDTSNLKAILLSPITSRIFDVQLL